MAVFVRVYEFVRLLLADSGFFMEMQQAVKPHYNFGGNSVRRHLAKQGYEYDLMLKDVEEWIYKRQQDDEWMFSGGNGE